MNQRELEIREVAKCARDFEYFASKYLKIVTKDSELRTLKINSAQRTIITSFEQNNYLMLLKARQ